MERIFFVLIISSLIAFNIVVWFKFFHSLFKIPIMKMLKSGQPEDDYITTSKRNINRLLTNESTRAFIDRTKVFYSDLSSGINGQFLYSPLGNMILINPESNNKQNVIEHELLHAVDNHLGITKSRTLKGIRLREKSERVYWLVNRFGCSLKDAQEFVDITEKERKYWTSDDELFATMNNMRLHMLKRGILRRKRDLITEDSITRILEEIRKDGTTKYDFFTMLSFVGTDSDLDLFSINGVFDMIDSLI